MTLKLPHKWVIGLSGVMLSGKSTALGFFKQCGAGVISADEIVGSLYERPAVRARLVRALGTADKAVLAAQIFTHARKRSVLEAILHPLVLKEMHRQAKACAQALVVCEIPLLFEAGWDKMVDMTLVVCADKKTLPARLKARHLTRAEYNRRLKQQLPETEKQRRADVVFLHTAKQDLELKVKRLCQAFDLLNNRSNNGR